jgi:hypothetical protein
MLNIGVPGLRTYAVAVDPPSIAAGGTANIDVTVAGPSAGDLVVGYEAPDTLEIGLVPITVRVIAENQVRVRLYNPTAAVIDGASRTWRFTLIELA